MLYEKNIREIMSGHENTHKDKLIDFLKNNTRLVNIRQVVSNGEAMFILCEYEYGGIEQGIFGNYTNWHRGSYIVGVARENIFVKYFWRYQSARDRDLFFTSKCIFSHERRVDKIVEIGIIGNEKIELIIKKGDVAHSNKFITEGVELTPHN